MPLRPPLPLTLNALIHKSNLFLILIIILGIYFLLFKNNITWGGTPHDPLLEEYEILPLPSIFPPIIKLWSLLWLTSLPHQK